MDLTHICLVLAVLPWAVWAQTLPEPCAVRERDGKGCTGGKVCRLVELDCPQPPCPLQDLCVDEPPRVSDCPVGEPVVDSVNRPIWCSSSKLCPTNTFCNDEVMDTQSTCCWGAQPGPVPPTISPPYNPCIATTCLQSMGCYVTPQDPASCPPFGPCPSLASVCLSPDSTRLRPCQLVDCRSGQTCVSRRPANCPYDNCIEEAECIGGAPDMVKAGQCPVPRPEPGICIARCGTDSECPGAQKCCGGCPRQCENPVSDSSTPTCTGFQCPSGQRCELLPTPCAPPGPCVDQPACVTDQTVKPGTCPVANGAGICVTDCRSDADCQGDRKCCSNGCGQVCLLPASVEPVNPCILALCPSGTVCVPQETNSCLSRPCSPVASCLNPQLACSQDCTGNTECRLQEVQCFRAPCPPTSTCVVRGTVIGDGSCPLGLPVIRSDNREIRCVDDSSCPDSTVCNTQSRVCCFDTDNQQGNPNKPGSCPPTTGFGICISECEDDSACSGSEKCCSNGCGTVCTAPVAAPPSTSTYPCLTMRCSSNQECRVRSQPCSTGTCLVGVCATRTTVSAGECAVGLPIQDNNGVEYFCGRGPSRRDCPSGTSCSIHPTDRFAVCCFQSEVSEPTPPQNSCALVDCQPGYICVERVNPCLVAPCPVDVQCVPLNNPGSCPVARGFGICVQQCEGDGDCGRTRKCCSNGCGNVCMEPATACTGVSCRSGFVCRLRERCNRRGSCSTRRICTARRFIDGRVSCPVGLPVLDSRNGMKSCGPGSNSASCPTGSYCYTDPADAFSVCCPSLSDTSVPVTRPPVVTTTTPAPRSCPRINTNNYFFNFICRFAYRACRSDSQCRSGQACCNTTPSCGRRCMSP